MKNPLNETELSRLTHLAGITMAQLVNVKSQTFKKLKPNLTQMLDKDIAQLIQDNPLIMVRPILTDDEQVVMGFKEDEYHKFTA